MNIQDPSALELAMGAGSAAFRLQNRGQQEGAGSGPWRRQFARFCSLKAALLCPETARQVVVFHLRFGASLELGSWFLDLSPC